LQHEKQHEMTPTIVINSFYESINSFYLLINSFYEFINSNKESIVATPLRQWRLRRRVSGGCGTHDVECVEGTSNSVWKED
jgi:hypothetical protein